MRLAIGLLTLAPLIYGQQGKAGRSVVITWTASTTSGVDYYVYRASGTCASAGSFSKINTTTITTTSYTDTNVADGTYCYYATSHLSTAIPPESTPSNKAEATVQSQPNPPTNLSVSPTTASLIVNQQQQFTASRNPVTWSIQPPEGTITTAGLYTAPSKIQGNNLAVQVIARDSDGTATADVQVRKK